MCGSDDFFGLDLLPLNVFSDEKKCEVLKVLEVLRVLKVYTNDLYKALRVTLC